MQRFFSVLLEIVFLSVFCLGQSRPVHVLAGFSWVSQDFSLTNDIGTGLVGWNASATFALQGRMGMVADFSGYYPGFNVGCSGCGQHAKMHTFLFGPQFSSTNGRVRPLARFLLGDTYMHTALDLFPQYVTFTSNNSFTYGAGGGVDFSLCRRFAIRGQVDWLHNGFRTADNQRRNEEIHNIARISTGLVVRFGGTTQ